MHAETPPETAPACAGGSEGRSQAQAQAQAGVSMYEGKEADEGGAGAAAAAAVASSQLPTRATELPACPSFMSLTWYRQGAASSANIVVMDFMKLPHAKQVKKYCAWYRHLFDFFEFQREERFRMVFDLRRVRLVECTPTLMKKKYALTEELADRTAENVACSVILVPKSKSRLVKGVVQLIRMFLEKGCREGRAPRMLETSPDRAVAFLQKYSTVPRSMRVPRIAPRDAVAGSGSSTVAGSDGDSDGDSSDAGLDSVLQHLSTKRG